MTEAETPFSDNPFAEKPEMHNSAEDNPEAFGKSNQIEENSKETLYEPSSRSEEHTSDL